MTPLESVLIWMSVVLYGISTALYVYSVVFRKEKVLDRMVYLVGIVFALQSVAVVLRYLAVGNLPFGGSDYETGLSASWFILLITLYAFFRHKGLRAIGIVTMPFSLIMLGFGLTSSPVLAPMAVSAKSIWLYIHVFFAWLAYGGFSVTSGIAAVYLLKEKNPEKDFYKRFPSLSTMQDLMFKYLVFGFITDAVMIASGALWAKDLWGNYWSWDPVETWSLVTWLIYGLAIHLRVTMGWKGAKFAWLLIFSLSGMVITYFGITFFIETSLHFFEAMQEGP